MKKIAEYNISIVNPEDYKKIVPHDFADNLTGGFALKDKGIAFVKDTGIPEFNIELVEHELQELLSAKSPHELDGIRYGWLSDIWGGDDEEEDEGSWWDKLIDPLLPESVKDNPLQSILAIGAAPFTGGASLAALLPFFAESGLGQLGVDLPNWIPGLASSLMLPGTGATLPGFGEGGMLSGLFENTATGTNMLDTLRNIPGIGGYFGATNSPLDILGLSTKGNLFQNILSGAKGGLSNIWNLGSSLLGGAQNLLDGTSGGGLGDILNSILGGGQQRGGGQQQGGGYDGGGYGGGNYGGGYDIGELLSTLLGGVGSVEQRNPAFPKLQTSEDIFNQAINYAKGNYPLAYGAREGALADLAKGTSYYAGFQPTSIEQILADKSFADMLEKTQRQTSHLGSLTGMESQIPYQFAKAMGPTTVSIGEYLSNLGNQRATASLNARLGINPQTITDPFAALQTTQGNAQSLGDWGTQTKQAEIDYQRNLAGAQSDALRNQALGGFGGDILQNIFGIPKEDPYEKILKFYLMGQPQKVY